MKELLKKVAKIQKELKAPKNQFNSFGKYKYRSCEDILEAVKPLLDGLVLTMSDNIQVIGDRVYVEATVCLRNDVDSLCVTACAREPLNQKGMNEAQITGSASTYARKYGLNGLFCIDDTKDADSTNPSDNTPTKKPIELTDANIKSAIDKGTQADVLKGIEDGKFSANGIQKDRLTKLK